MYLIRKSRPNARAHIWDGKDTACRMWSSGGLKQTLSDWVAVDVTCGQPVCSMCKANAAKHLHAQADNPYSAHNNTPSGDEDSERTRRARAAFARYIDVRREEGWTGEQLAGLKRLAKSVMTWPDEKLLALYPAGLFGSADEVRDAFIGFWEVA